jgi:hypothetical protein
MSITKLARATEPLPGLKTKVDGFDRLDRASWRMVVHSEVPNLKKWFHGLVLSLSKGSPLAHHGRVVDGARRIISMTSAMVTFLGTTLYRAEARMSRGLPEIQS